MAKTRLRNDDRAAIRRDIIEHKFQPLEAALLREEVALATQARAKAYGDYVQTIEAAPDGAFMEDTDVTVNVSGCRLRFRFGADYRTTVRLFWKHQHEDILSLPDSDKFAAKALDWAKRSLAAKASRDDLKRQVGAALQGFNTFDDLAAGWPEAEQFIRERWAKRSDYVSNVPAVQIATLTAALDLPPETQSEAA